jgi:DNA-binding Xre family transcriptional regulator
MRGLMQSVQQKLKYQMEKSGIKPHTLAKVAGVPESSIKNIVYGRSTKPSLELIDALAIKLNCKVSDLLSDDDQRINKKSKQEEGGVWDGMLYVSALQAVLEVAKLENMNLSRQEANSFAERVYQYAILNKEQNIDHKFTKYILLSS